MNVTCDCGKTYPEKRERNHGCNCPSLRRNGGHGRMPPRCLLAALPDGVRRGDWFFTTKGTLVTVEIR